MKKKKLKNTMGKEQIFPFNEDSYCLNQMPMKLKYCLLGPFHFQFSQELKYQEEEMREKYRM